MPKPSALSSRWSGRLPALLVALAAAAAYSNSLRGPFVLDDLPSIAGNASIRRWSTALAAPMASTTHGRPLLNLSFALNYAVSFQDVWSYHALNLLIHIGCALLLYAIVRRTLPAAFGPAAPLIAGFSAAIWAVHPLTTEAVTYTVQRAESLAGLFYLLTLYCFIRASAVGTGRADAWSVASVLACLLGMAVKEVMVTAPVVVLIYDRTFLSGSFLAALRMRWKLYGGFAAGWVLLAGLVISTHGRGGTAGFASGVSAWAYGLTQCRAIAHYLRLCLYPSPLVFYYGKALATAPAVVLPAAALLAVLLAATLWALAKAPPLGFLGAAFFLTLAPSSSIVPIATETMAEHRMYLALMPVVVLAVLGIHRWLGSRGWWILLALAGGLATTTRARNQSYGSAFRLWSDTVAADPGNPWAHNNLGCEFDSIPGRSSEAIAQYEIALRLKPDHAEAHYNLANDLRVMPGRLNEAIAHYQQAVESDPAFPKAHNNLADVLATMPGRLSEAIAHYQEALRLYPGYAEAHFNLGNAWLAVGGRESDAIREYEAALRLRPDYSEAHNNLGQVLAGSQATAAAAVEHFRRALAIDPGNSAAHYNLAEMLLRQPGREEEARSHLQAALRLAPDNDSARRLLNSLPGR